MANLRRPIVCSLLASLVLAITATTTTTASAADLIRVGKASATTFAFAPIEIGKERGIWAKHNLEVQSIGFGGDARLQQAMVADSIDFALGSGPAAEAKGGQARTRAMTSSQNSDLAGAEGLLNAFMISPFRAGGSPERNCR